MGRREVDGDINERRLDIELILAKAVMSNGGEGEGHYISLSFYKFEILYNRVLKINAKKYIFHMMFCTSNFHFLSPFTRLIFTCNTS